MKQKKTIILGLPESFEFNKLIIKNLELLNFNVVNVSFPEHGRLKKSLLEFLIYSYRKIILNDKNYKSVLKFAPHRNSLFKKINEINGKADYTLLFRADIYPLEFVLKLKEKSNSLITYHWDGLNRFPAINKLIPLFDRFFVFDPDDLIKPFLPTTNFYFDSETSDIELPIENDLYFMGVFITKRMPQIEKFIKSSRYLNLKLNFQIYCISDKKRNKFNYPEINYITSHITYLQNLENLKKSKIVLDFLNGEHNGLSFRVFECIQFDKKLITNNANIKSYEFYHPNNIYIWNEENLDGLQEFINSDYIIQPQIKEKYSFSNWIKYILNTPPFQEINLPLTTS